MKDSFAALGVSADVERVLTARDINTPFRIQELVVPPALGGSDILAKAPTGSGKTLAFGLPIVERLDLNADAPAALVLVPTRELALQVTEAMAEIGRVKGLRVATVYGGAVFGAQAKEARRAHVLVATPGRLNDFLERKMLSVASVHVLVLDEADRMLDMGFKPQVEKIMRRLPSERQTMLFSATLDGEVAELARAYTRNPAKFEAELPKQAEYGKIEHSFVAVSADAKVEKLIEHLDAERGLALVFVRTKRGADRLVHKLARHDVRAAALHGDMSQNARERALGRFREGKVTTLVATDVAARGLDLQEITHVINFDPPEDDKGYVHRVGRTGRAGRSGTGITFVLPEQQADVSRVAMRLGHRERFEENGMQAARPKLLYTSRRGRRSRW
jgi:ATP-dependent RNA helicase RhlE